MLLLCQHTKQFPAVFPCQNYTHYDYCRSSYSTDYSHNRCSHAAKRACYLRCVDRRISRKRRTCHRQTCNQRHKTNGQTMLQTLKCLFHYRTPPKDLNKFMDKPIPSPNNVTNPDRPIPQITDT